MKIRANALVEQIFKAPVALVFPTEKVTAKGETIYGNAKFVGTFRTLPPEESEQQYLDINNAQKSGDTEALLKLIQAQIASYFVGFEPLPSEEFPLTDDNDVPLVSNSENIKHILRISEVRNSVQKAYAAARSESVLEKNLKK